MIEKEMWEKHPKKVIVGADEVGRGSIAGPIVAASVKLCNNDIKHLTNIKDSKKLTELKRNEIYEYIKKTNIRVKYAMMTNKEIDKYGISHCNKEVLIKVFRPYLGRGYSLYVDYVKGLDDEIESLTKGEDKSLAIALASIMAKVYRDQIMINLSLNFPEYKLANNKGYGTKKHYEAITQYGMQGFHRKTFLSNL